MNLVKHSTSTAEQLIYSSVSVLYIDQKLINPCLKTRGCEDSRMASLRLQRPSALLRHQQPSNSLLSASLGGKGTRLGQFDNCAAITTLSDGNIAVADTNNNRVQIISPKGHPITSVGHKHLTSPWGITALPFGKFCVSEGVKKRIVVYTDSGKLVSKIKLHEVEEPCALATCPSTGNIIVTDYNRDKVFIYDLDGTLLDTLTTEVDLLSGENPCPDDVSVDRYGNIFLSFGFGCSEMQVFDNRSSRLKLKFGNFTSASGIHVTAKDNVLIAEKEQRTVCLYSTSGQFIQQLVTPVNGMQGYPQGVTVVNGGTVVVTAADQPYGCPTWLYFYKLG